MKRAGLIVSWGVLAALMSTVAYQIVAAAESQVSDEALTPIVAITTETSTTTDRQPGISAPTSTTAPSDPSTSVPSGITSTTSTTTATTTPSSSTTTTINTSTTSGTPWTTRTVPSAGGDVVIEYRPGEVRLVVARPAAGYNVEVESAGPSSVEVKFENNDEKIRIKAQWENGELEVKIEGPEGEG